MSPELKEETQEQTTPRVYDAKAPQKIPFKSLSDDFTITATVNPIGDNLYLESYDAHAALKITDGGENAVSDNTDGLVGLFDAAVPDVEGFPGEKPHDWKEQLDADAYKLPIMARVLAIVCYDAPFAWGQKSRAVHSESYYNGEKVEGKHFLRKKQVSDVRAYRNLQKIPMGGKGKGLESATDVVIPPHTKEKARLYDLMKEQDAEGYMDGIVPIWHKAAVIDHVFSSGISAKK